MAEKITRTMPHDLNAEAAVLSAMMIDNTHCAKAFSQLSEDHFYKPAHRLLYRNMKELFNTGVVIDAITMLDVLDRNGVVEKIGGKEYLLELSDVVFSGANIDFYAQIIQSKFYLRSLIEASNQIIETCYNQGKETEEILDEAEKIIFEATENKTVKSFVAIGDLLEETLGEIEEIAKTKSTTQGINSGFSKLDEVIGGFRKGHLSIVAARPSMGKTSLALNIAYNAVAKDNKKIAIFSMEMGFDELIMRMLAAPSGVSSSLMTKGYRMTPERIRQITQVSISLENKNIYIDDSGMNTMFTLRAKARRLAAEINGIDLIIIDYLQLMSSTKSRDNRQQEIAEISRSLKVMAKELNVPIIAISQLSRGVESRENKRPLLSDLRESGAIEQDADIVIFIYRDEYYHPDTDAKNIAELIIGKNRHGPTATIEVHFNADITKFSSLDTRYDEEDF